MSDQTMKSIIPNHPPVTLCFLCRTSPFVSDKPFISIQYHIDVCTPCFYSFIQPSPTHSQSTFLLEDPKGGGPYSDFISTKIGSEAEQKFWSLCQSKGFLIRSSTPHENRISHFDFVVGLAMDRFVRVEVKSTKARRRGDTPDPSVVFLEIQNIDGGPGWIYGKCDYVAFEHPKGFILFPNQEIVSYVERYSQTFPFVTQSGIDFTLYGRRQRKDIVMVVPFAELNFRISHKLFL